MGVVIINGKKYDSVSGLQIDEPVAIAEPIEEQIIEVTTKLKRRSKQERLAEAVAREFEEAIAEPVIREVPDWISEFTVQQQTKVMASQPDWITNYVTGGDPIEIQPIGLEAAARETAEQPAEQSVRAAAPQNRRAPQRSQTLNRSFVQKPTSSAPITTHPEVQHFAPVQEQIETIAPSEAKAEAEASFAPIMTHNMEEKLAQREFAKIAPISSSSDLKNALINEQMDQPIDRKARAKAEKKASRIHRRFTVPTLITAALAVLVLGGYFTYVNMPSISVRVAAARAGVDARAPYTPNGYSIDGPVAYAPGRVTINYKSNGGGVGYSFTQQKNTWGDNVIIDTLVDDNDYTTLQAGKVTIYRYGDNAAWIYNGILFTLNGNESLGDNQITRIAESV